MNITGEHHEVVVRLEDRPVTGEIDGDVIVGAASGALRKPATRPATA